LLKISFRASQGPKRRRQVANEIEDDIFSVPGGTSLRFAQAPTASFNLNAISDSDSRFAADFPPHDGLILGSNVANECCAIANDAKVSDIAKNGYKSFVNPFACVIRKL
jgi:hypothetical protein